MWKRSTKDRDEELNNYSGTMTSCNQSIIRKSVERFFRKNHAPQKTQSAMMIHPQRIAPLIAIGSVDSGARRHKQ
jgi:hypothetical protein